MLHHSFKCYIERIQMALWHNATVLHDWPKWIVMSRLMNDLINQHGQYYCLISAYHTLVSPFMSANR